nr:DsbA family protein [Myxococcota bacterium]
EAALARCAVDPGSAPEVTETPRRLTTFFDFKGPQSYVALPTLLALKQDGISLDWRPFVSRPLNAPADEAPGEDRSTKHRRIRGEYHVNDLQRYAPHPLTDLHRETDCRFADMGLLWLQREQGAGRDVIDDYVARVFAHLWREGRGVDSAEAIAALLEAASEPAQAGEELADAWLVYARGEGPAQLESVREEARARSIAAAPTFVLGAEPFQGHAHLPLITARLKAGI